MHDSDLTQPLFEKAVEEIKRCLDSKEVEDPVYMDVVLKAYLGHIKLKNLEIREDMLKFAIGRELSENIQGLKQTLRESLPKYIKP
jgi:hypothetical protein